MNGLDVLHEIPPIFPFEHFGAELTGDLVIVVSPGLLSMSDLPVVTQGVLAEKLFITKLALMGQ